MNRSVMWRDAAVLFVVALVARVLAGLLVPAPPYVDASYTTLVAERLATGHGFSVPVLWSFLEVGGRLPAEGVLPVPSNAHWMPLSSIVASLGMMLGGPGWRGAQLVIIPLAASMVPLTYLVGADLWRSRRVAVIAAILALFAGPMLVMTPLVESFAVFGLAGAGAVYAAVQAVRAERFGPWLLISGALAGLATLARVDGVLLVVAPATAWIARGGLRLRPAMLGWGIGSALLFTIVLAPWLLRNVEVFGAPLPSTGGHTLWITSYNEQFSLSADPSLASYAAWGLPNIIGSKLVSWGELVGRTTVLLGGIFIIGLVYGLWSERGRSELWPFLAYFVTMFVAMGWLFTFHAPKGAYYHSAWAWLPFALPMAVAGLDAAALACSRWWKFLARPRARAFLVSAGVAGAVILSLVGSAILVVQWSRTADQMSAAAAFVVSEEPSGRVMAYDAPTFYVHSGVETVAPPFDPYPVVREVIDRYNIQWVVVSMLPGEATDPLGLWEGRESVDIEGNRATFIESEPSFEAPGVRVYAVTP